MSRPDAKKAAARLAASLCRKGLKTFDRNEEAGLLVDLDQRAELVRIIAEMEERAGMGEVKSLEMFPAAKAGKA